MQATLDDDTVVSIEMQMNNEGNILERTAFYAGKVMSSAMHKAEPYKKLPSIIMVNILNYNLLKYDEYISKTEIVLEKHKECEMIKNLRWYFIELPKIRKAKPDMNEAVNQWLALIDNEDMELVKMAEEKNKTIKSAMVEVEHLTGEEEVRRLAELKEKWERDRISGLYNAKEEAKLEVAKNMLKKGLAPELISEVTGLTKEEIEKLPKTK